MAGVLFVAGIVLFCGSLYLSVATGWRDVTMAAPLGGVAFIPGWLLVVGTGVVKLRRG